MSETSPFRAGLITLAAANAGVVAGLLGYFLATAPPGGPFVAPFVGMAAFLAGLPISGLLGVIALRSGLRHAVRRRGWPWLDLGALGLALVAAFAWLVLWFGSIDLAT